MASLAAIVILLGMAGGAARAAAADDPFVWLEDVNGEKPLAWVRAENAKTVGVLEADPRFATLYAEALHIARAKDRIPEPAMIGDKIYNFWRDADHERGVWRRTSPRDYATPEPHWTTVLDLDALARTENANWVWHGANCRAPAYDRCLVSLSDGGEDASTDREFDLASGQFVPGGFDLPHSKQNVDWLDDDTLLVARDWGPGTMTASGYPFVVKTLRRGQALADAHEVFRGTPADVLVGVSTMHDGGGVRLTLITRATDFFHSEIYELTAGGAVKLDLPAKVNLRGFVRGQLVFSIDQDWTFQGRSYTAGSLLAVAPRFLTPGAAGVTPHPLVYAPGPRQAIEQVAATKTRIVAAIFDNVRGGLFVFQRARDGQWAAKRLPVASDSSVSLAASIETSERFYYGVDNYLDPPSLFAANAANGAAGQVKSLPARFDASNEAVDQYEAVAGDGTKVPYFVVHPKGMPLDGSNPTILYAYGGFQVSLTPGYSGGVGKLWLERGGVYVVANIRGGGEFGPAWHDAALKTNRQLAWDDFAAVAKDLIARKITSPRRLGIQGGSNGGLLMGVELDRKPDLFGAIVCQVPLLDMKRYNKLLAGASWMAEYGDPAVPEEWAAIATYSPYQNVKKGVKYPRTLFTTSTRDDRVHPGHARKMVARMLEQGHDVLYFENVEGGHGGAADSEQRARISAMEFAFLAKQLGLSLQ